MLAKNAKRYPILLLIADFFTLVASFGFAYLARVSLDDRNLITPRDDSNYFFAVLAIVPAWILLLAVLNLYSSVTYNRRLVEWGKLAIGSFIGVLFVIGWEYISDERIFPARLVTIYVLIGSFLLLVLEREILRWVRQLAYRFGKGTSRVLIIGNSAATRDIAERLAILRRAALRL